MALKQIYIILLTAVTMLPWTANHLQAGMDPVRMQLLNGNTVPLTWNNVDGPPELLNEHPIRTDSYKGYRLITFNPGEDVLLRLPAHSMIRLFNPLGTLANTPFIISTSSGNGLFTNQPAMVSRDSTSIFVDPGLQKPGLAQIELSRQASSPIAIALFTSHYATVGAPAAYLDAMTLTAPDAQLTKRPYESGQTFYLLKANRPVQVRVWGPAHYSLEQRMLYSPKEQESRVDYTVVGRLNTRNYFNFEITTEPESKRLIRANKEYPFIGRRENSFFSIPEGEHILTLVPTQTLYARLVRKEASNFLFPDRNDPFFYQAETTLEEREILNTVYPFYKRPPITSLVPVNEAETFSNLLWRDNRFSEGGLASAMAISRLAAYYPALSEVRQNSQEIAGAHSFFRTIIPQSESTPVAQHHITFTSPILKNDEFQTLVFHPDTASHLRGEHFKTAQFSELPPNDPGQDSNVSLRYNLPKRQTTSEIRLQVVIDQESHSFGVTIGNAPQIICNLRPETIRPANEYRLTPYDTARLLTPLSTDQLLIPSVYSRAKRVGTITVPLVQSADTVLIHRLDDSQQPILVSLQFRDSRPFDLTEPQYLQAVTDLGNTRTVFNLATELLAMDDVQENKEPVQTNPEADLSSFFRPLVRLIKTLATDYTSSVYPLSQKFLSDQQSSVETLNYTRALLNRAEAMRQWVLVVEYSSFLYQTTTGELKRRAAEQMINGLLNCGEHYLAELHLKGILLYPEESDGDLARWAQHRLEQLYLAQKNLRRLAALYAAILQRTPTSRIFGKFGRILLEQGKSSLALRAALIPQPSNRSNELILQASLAAGWWNTFNDALLTVSDNNTRILWRGLEQLERGNRKDAREIFQDLVSDPGYLKVLDEADKIQAGLKSPDISKRLKAISSWEEWQKTFPGQAVWNSEPHHIYEHAGGALLHSQSQDLHMLMYKSEHNRPVRFRVWGPVTISTSIRPLHHRDDTSPVNGWIRMNTNKELDLIPITNNLPNQQWRLSDNERSVPGMVTEYRHKLGPGLHDISIASDNLALLVSLQILRPAVKGLGLPFLSKDVVDAVLDDKTLPAPPQKISQLSCLKSDCVTLLPEHPSEKPRFFAAASFYSTFVETPFTPSMSSSPSDRVEPYRFRKPEDAPRTVAKLMAQKEWQEALSHSTISSTEECEKFLTLLTFLSEIDPGKRIHYEARARDILSRYPSSTTGSSLLRRISAHSRWEQVPFIQGSAGIRMLPYQTWRPEEPALRIRKSLLRKQPEGQTVLTGTESVVLAMNNETDTSLSMTFTVAELPYLQPESITIAYQVDDNNPNLLRLSPETPKKIITLSIPEGDHRLSVSILERYTNQYLWIQFDESSHPSQQGNHLNSRWSTHNKERAFHVVSHQEPLIAMVPGPAWIRIDELRNGIISSAYRYVDPNVKRVKIMPNKNGEERLVRIFQRVVDRNIDGDHLMRTTIRNYQNVLPPQLKPVNNQIHPSQQILINLPPPLPELEGSVSTTLSYHRRRDLQEDSTSDDPETFIQLSGKYETFYSSVNAYLKSSLLFRRRERGGPTIGITGDYSWKKDYLPITLRIQGEFLAQNPNGSSLALFDWDPFEWSAKLKFTAYQYRPITSKLTHRPMLSVFARLLSTDSGDGYHPGTLDQDIFTPYKADHKTGMQISEYLSYRPWLDTQINGRAVIALNEDYNPLQPDHLRLAVGWRQLYGQYQVSTGYQFTRFFEDEDRPDIIDKNDVSLEFLWDPLFSADNWLQFHFKYRFQIDTGEHTGMVGLTWYLGGNRAIFLKRPEDDPFNTIRRIRAVTRNYRRAF